MKRTHLLAAIYAIGLIGIAAAAVMPGRAHPPSIVNAAAEKAVGEEIQAFRASVAAAVAAKDAKKLSDYFAPSFAHTHATGKTDNREAHIRALLSGDPVIETAPAKDLVIRVPNDWVAIATGTSALKAADEQIHSVKWMAVYTRAGQSWVLVASQATRAQAQAIKP